MKIAEAYLDKEPLDYDEFYVDSYITETPLVFKTVHEMKCDLVAHTMYMQNPDAVSFEDKYGTASLLPCSAARVSHGKEDKTGEDIQKDIKLMNFLGDHNHLTPFEHQSATFLVECPIFVAREWMRHRTQSFNEISRRYTADDTNVFWIPDEWRKQSVSNRQSSHGVVKDDQLNREYKLLCQHALFAYEEMIERGVAREQARAVLPVGSVTKFYVTANLRNWAHWYKLRIAPDAQYEIRVYAERVGKALEELWGEAWKALTKEQS
jgi:thymidylate synthase (FAD)